MQVKKEDAMKKNSLENPELIAFGKRLKDIFPGKSFPAHRNSFPAHR